MAAPQMPPAAAAGGEPHPPVLWDPVVRLTHWVLALAVLVNAALTEDGGTVHVWIGYAALAVLALRLVWGLVGPAPARFAAFPPDPRAAYAHLVALAAGRPGRYPSHNPAGALMAYALWAALAVVVASGVLMTAGGPGDEAAMRAAVARGDWSVLADAAPWVGDAAAEVLEEVHEVAANLILLLAALHVAGVAVESRAMGVNLLRAMLPWRR
ncbi:MAG: cytochrome b/b6 domain-containing protein [Gemmobacter sp.]